jgi:hypothetical protein
MKQYICRIWSYGGNAECMLSRDNESLKEFRERVISVFPYTEGYHHQFSEFKEIWL